jgi:hypothetical protein
MATTGGSWRGPRPTGPSRAHRRPWSSRGIPWRTTWKYGERGYRHLFWDSGAVLANCLAVTEAVGVTSRVLTGFVDDEVSHLLAIGSPEEYPLVIVPLAGGPGARPAAAADRPPAIDHRVHPLSASPHHHAELAAVHQAGVLTDTDEVTGWRTAVARLGTPVTREVPVSPGGHRTIEDVIVRRGSTRRYARDPVGEDMLRWGLAVGLLSPAHRLRRSWAHPARAFPRGPRRRGCRTGHLPADTPRCPLHP